MLHRRHVPALEEFCLVVCHVCNQVVTPQGILAHYGKAQRSAAFWEIPAAPREHTDGGAVGLMDEHHSVLSGLLKHGLRAPQPAHRQPQQRLKHAKLYTTIDRLKGRAPLVS